jgi:hypothetical protein
MHIRIRLPDHLRLKQSPFAAMNRPSAQQMRPKDRWQADQSLGACWWLFLSCFHSKPTLTILEGLPTEPIYKNER